MSSNTVEAVRVVAVELVNQVCSAYRVLCEIGGGIVLLAEIIQALRAGYTDALANRLFGSFDEFIDTVSSGPEISTSFKRNLSEGFVVLLKQYLVKVRTTLPPHCHNDCLSYVDPADLRRAAEHFFTKAQSMESGSATDAMMSLMMRLGAYYLLARSWRDIQRPVRSADDLNSSVMLGTRIEMRIEKFLQENGQTLPA